MKTVTQAHLQFSSSLREGVEWGGGWGRINSFSFFKENKQYKRMINNSAASLWKNISISTEKIICSRDLCFQVIMYLSMSSRRRGEARHRAGFWLFPKKLVISCIYNLTSKQIKHNINFLWRITVQSYEIHVARILEGLLEKAGFFYSISRVFSLSALAQFTATLPKRKNQGNGNTQTRSPIFFFQGE